MAAVRVDLWAEMKVYSTVERWADKKVVSWALSRDMPMAERKAVPWAVTTAVLMEKWSVGPMELRTVVKKVGYLAGHLV